jgi:hypothetical protein
MARTHGLRHGLSTLIVAGTAVATLVTLPPSAGATSPPSQAPSALPAGFHFAPYPRDVSPMAESGDITAGDCTYRQATDNAHVTSGEVSVHGYWIFRTGTCPSKANVDVDLQAFGCGPFICQWITVASGSREVPPGTSRRANARLACASTSTVGWRGLVDVDLIGVGDPSGRTSSDPQNLSCSPPS